MEMLKFCNVLIFNAKKKKKNTTLVPFQKEYYMFLSESVCAMS